MPKLGKQEQAYNACVDAKTEAYGALLDALDDYNRAAQACETLMPLKLFPKFLLASEKFA